MSTKFNKNVQRRRLLALNKLKKSVCYCSKCGTKLQYRSFTVHPCFKRAVQLFGKYEAKMRVYRASKPGISLRYRDDESTAGENVAYVAV